MCIGSVFVVFSLQLLVISTCLIQCLWSTPVVPQIVWAHSQCLRLLCSNNDNISSDVRYDSFMLARNACMTIVSLCTTVRVWYTHKLTGAVSCSCDHSALEFVAERAASIGYHAACASEPSLVVIS